MALYRYIKAQPAYAVATTALYAPAATPASFNPTKIIPWAMMTVGFIVISIVITPMVYYELVTSPKLRRTAFVSPLPGTITELQARTQVAGISTHAAPQPIPAITQPSLAPADYTEATNWFPSAPVLSPSPSKITHYTVDIPRLNIKNAVVTIGGSDLKKTLVQYGGTANPGEYGSTIIFGHSILREFYNPAESNPGRYISIFSTIMTLSKGDDMHINFDGIDYTYQVVDKYVISPTQVEVLQQRYDRQTIKLITCTPEGTYKERGVVEAQLIKT